MKKKILLLTLLTLLTLTACHSNPNRPHISLPISLIYLPSTKPDPLTPAELDDIKSHLSTLQAPPIWFILICSNDTTDPENIHYTTIVYFIPDKQTVIRTPDLFVPGTPIIREGRCISVNNPHLGEPPTLSALDTYIQVPDPTNSPNPVLIPALSELPILKPDNIADADLIQLITLARAAYPAHDIDPDSPILAITRNNTPLDSYDIQIAGPTPDQGPTLRIRHFNHYFAIDPQKYTWTN